MFPLKHCHHWSHHAHAQLIHRVTHKKSNMFIYTYDVTHVNLYIMNKQYKKPCNTCLGVNNGINTYVCTLIQKIVGQQCTCHLCVTGLISNAIDCFDYSSRRPSYCGLHVHFINHVTVCTCVLRFFGGWTSVAKVEVSRFTCANLTTMGKLKKKKEINPISLICLSTHTMSTH